MKAVDGVDLRRRASGEISALVGESGSGKTVTGFSILGLVDPPGRIVAGAIRLDGEDLAGLSERGDARAARPPHRDDLPGPDDDAQPGAAHRHADDRGGHARTSSVVARAARARARDALGAVGIPRPRSGCAPIRTSSPAACASASPSPSRSCTGRELLIADEPTTALDVTIQAQILAEVQTLCRETGTALIWITHDLAVVAGLADRIAVMYAGRIVETGPGGRRARRARCIPTRAA